MKRDKRNLVGAVSVILIILLVFSASIWGFGKMNREAILERNTEFLKDNTERHAEMLSDALKSRLRFVENLAVLLERSSERDYLHFMDTLNAIEGNTFIDDLFFVTPQGTRYFPDGQQWEVRNTDFFKNAVEGMSGITEINGSRYEPDKKYVACYAPVLFEGKVGGIVVGCNYYNDFAGLYEMQEAEPYIYSYLIDGKGQILLANEELNGRNVFPFLEGTMEAADFEALTSDVKGQGTGSGSYQGAYGEGLVCFAELGINDWYVVQMFSSEKTAEMIAPLNRSAYRMEAAMLFCLILAVVYSLYLMYIKYNQKNRLMEMSLEALAESFPRIASVDTKTGNCTFVKDREKTAPILFQKCDWDAFREQLLDAIHPEDREKCKSFTALENMRRVLEQELISDTCIYRRMYEGEYQWLRTSIIPVHTEENCILIYVRKVDETVKSEEFYKAKLWEALQMTKEAETEKTEFLKYMSQDLRTPINAIIGMTARTVEAIRDGNSEEALRHLDGMDTVGSYILTMLSDIVEVGVVQQKHVRCVKEPFSVRRLLEGYREYYTGFDCIDENIHFEVECDDKLRELYNGDEARIFQILNALLSNAFLFNREGGSVLLRGRVEETGEEKDKLSFTVSDTGKGISEEFKPFLFDLFAKEQQFSGKIRLGTGLGLPMAKLALDSMGGEMEVESTPGQGSSFTMRIELEHASKEDKEAKSFRVLVVDDNELSLKIVVENLKAEGYEAEGYSSGEAALQAFMDSEPGYFQCLLTDIRMPGMDGCELAGKIREASGSDSKTICMIALSAALDVQKRESATEQGIEEILEKPFRMAQFQEVLQRRKKKGFYECGG